MQPPEIFAIPGYAVWRGRYLMHARYLGTYAQARKEMRPWHVVAPGILELWELVQPQHDDRTVISWRRTHFDKRHR